MGIFGKLFGSDGAPDRYRTEAEYKKNRLLQAQQSADQMRELAEPVGDRATAQRLNYIFRAHKKKSARKLAQALEERQYEASVTEGADRHFVISGRSPALALTSEVIVSWTDDMCRFGYEYDTEFEGWYLD